MNLKVLFPSSALRCFLFLGISCVAYNLYCVFSNPYEPQRIKGSHALQLRGEAIENSDGGRDYANFLVASLEALTKTTEESSRLITKIKRSNGHNFDSSQQKLLPQDVFESNEAEEQRWSTQLLSKLKRIRKPSSLGGIFLYHMRKAAGTTVRDLLIAASGRWNTSFYESEGRSLNKLLLDQNVLLVTSLRDPIRRIYSLYWYEHVGWFDGVLHETEKCKSFLTWIEGWRDGSEWKNNFMLKNPRSVYIEIENYYVKALSGWIGPAPVGEMDFKMAISALDRFDLVFVTEWMDRSDQKEAMKLLFSISPDNTDNLRNQNSGMVPGTHGVGHELQGDKSVKDRLSPSLASNQEEIEKLLVSINSYDIRLWEYALKTLKVKLPLVAFTAKKVLHNMHTSSESKTSYTAHIFNSLKSKSIAAAGNGVESSEHSSESSSVYQKTLDPGLIKDIGIFRPPGHKGPF